MAAMLKAANEGQYNFLSEVKVYGDRAQKLKEIFLRHGFYLYMTMTWAIRLPTDFTSPSAIRE